VRLVRRWLPTRELGVVGDHRDAALEGLEVVRHTLGVIPRLRLDAARYEPAPPRQPRQHGRPRTKGKRRPTLEKVVTASMTPGTAVIMPNWSGHGKRRGQITADTAVW
jgi:hypothetical protein